MEISHPDRRIKGSLFGATTILKTLVVKAEGEEACKKGVVICYDCRLNSEKFAREAAGVMAANGDHFHYHLQSKHKSKS